MKVSDSDYSMLKKIDSEIDLFFSASFSSKEVRSTDIYDFIKFKEPFKKRFHSGIDFNRFLRRMEQSGLLKAVIPNISVDTSNSSFYQWRFYRKTTSNSNDVNADSVETNFRFFKGNKTVLANDGVMLRSLQEKYIYNRLLNEKEFLVYYERKLKERYPDFTIANKNTKVVYIWEHFGMTNNIQYLEKIDERLEWYRSHGYKYIENGGRLVVTFYKNDNEFESTVERIIELMKLRR